jgi:hypothetical protein
VSNGAGQFDFSGHGSVPARPAGGGAPSGASATPSFGAPAGPSFVAPPPAGGAPSSPVGWLFAGVALAVAAGSAAALFSTVPLITLAAWFVAGPVAISLFAVFTYRDTAFRTDALYSVAAWVTWLYRLGLIVVFAAIITSALAIALWVGRL